MLGHALFDTKKFGFPLEYLNPANLHEWGRLLGTRNVLDTIGGLEKIRTSENGVFSIKIHYSQLVSVGGYQNFCNLFPLAKIIFLKRRNLVHQAVSYARALQTGVWISGQRPVSTEANYDYRLIDRCLRELIRDNARWHYALESYGYRYLELYFEDVKSDITKALADIAHFLNVNLRHSEVGPYQRTSAQGDELNHQWAIRYVEESKASGFVDLLDQMG